MSLHFNKYVPPNHCQVKFQFKSGTPVRIRTLNGGVYEGEVLVTDQNNGSLPLFFELVNVLKLGSAEGSARSSLYARFEPRELIAVEVLGPPNVKSFIRATEKLHQTLFVDSSEMFGKLEKILQEEDKPKKVGINFYGLDVGRKGDLYLMVMFMMDTIVIIDYEQLLEKCQDFMFRLDTVLFSNEDILKVVYNGRPIADFLYHYHSIYLKNVFDIQVAEFYLWARGQLASDIESKRKNLKYKPLSDILVEFIGANVIPDQEVEILKEFEKKEKHFNELTHPLKERPVKDMMAKKFVSIGVKHLLALHDAMNKRMQEKFVECVSTNMCTHVGRNEFYSSYDHSDQLSIPPTVISKFTTPKLAVSSTTETLAPVKVTKSPVTSKTTQRKRRT